MINELKETHNQNVDQQNGFHHLLDEMKIPYVEEGAYLNVGEIPEINGWVLFLSVGISSIADLVKVVCPVLFNAGVSFSLIKDKSIASQQNEFWFGPNEVGKMIIIFTVETAITKVMIDQLGQITSSFRGPYVNNAIRLDEIIYVTYIGYVDQQGADGGEKKLANVLVPDARKLPFKVDRKYQFWKRKKILKRRYVPLVMLDKSPKGDLLKSVDLKGLKFNWCFIKEGKRHVFDDRHGRDINDRFKWQAKVLQELHGLVPLPRFIDYFEQDEEYYLVMEYLDGVDLFRKIERIYEKKCWHDLSGDEQQQLIGYFREVLQIIRTMHQLGYVHRDATAGNFMVLNTGKVYTIDLELSYHLPTDNPRPPFALGAFGYASPEQMKLQPPTVKEDIYTMGALLLHILTGKHPNNYINRNNEVNIERVRKDVEVVVLLEIMLRCFEVNPGDRPVLEELIQVTDTVFQ